LKPLWRERAAYFEPAIFRFVVVENEPRGGELDQAKPEVPSVPVGLVCLDIANAIATDRRPRVGNLRCHVSIRNSATVLAA
jgi:hypothetical protein